MNLIRDVLDNQLVDRNQRRMGKVDGIIIELRDNAPPRLVYIEVGMTTLARRIHPRLANWLKGIAEKWGAKQSQPLKISWSKVQDVGIDVDIDLDAEETSALAYEKWLRDAIIAKVPGEKS